MKKLSTFALAFAFAGFVAATAQAGSVTEYSQTWKPGFTADDSGAQRYSRTLDVQDTVETAGVKVLSEYSQVWKPGFQADDSGTHRYSRTVVKPAGVTEQASTEPSVEYSHTWKPGFIADDSSAYRYSRPISG